MLCKWNIGGDYMLLSNLSQRPYLIYSAILDCFSKIHRESKLSDVLMLVSHCGEYASECAYEWQSLKLRNIRRVFVSVGNKFGTFTSHSPPPYEDRSI